MLSGSLSPGEEPPSTTTAQLIAVQEAFAGDDVIKEFHEEKQKLIDDSKAKTVDLTLPGICTLSCTCLPPHFMYMHVYPPIITSIEYLHICAGHTTGLFALYGSLYVWYVAVYTCRSVLPYQS